MPCRLDVRLLAAENSAASGKNFQVLAQNSGEADKVGTVLPQASQAI